MRGRSVNNDPAVIQQPGCIRRHFKNLQLVFHPAAAESESVNQPGSSIIVPERTRVYPAGGSVQAIGFAPLASRIPGVGNKNTLVGQTVENPEQAPMETNGGRPNPLSRLNAIVFRRRQAFNNMVNDLPVDEIARVEKR